MLPSDSLPRALRISSKYSSCSAPGKESPWPSHKPVGCTPRTGRTQHTHTDTHTDTEARWTSFGRVGFHVMARFTPQVVLLSSDLSTRTSSSSLPSSSIRTIGSTFHTKRIHLHPNLTHHNTNNHKRTSIVIAMLARSLTQSGARAARSLALRSGSVRMVTPAVARRALLTSAAQRSFALGAQNTTFAAQR